MSPIALPLRQILLRLLLALAIVFNGFLAPLAMAHGGHSTMHREVAASHAGCHGHADAATHHHDAANSHLATPGCPQGCCDGVNCDCGCMMHVAGLFAPMTLLIHLAPPSVLTFNAPSPQSATQLPSLRPPIA